jgi:hypothetical protein
MRKGSDSQKARMLRGDPYRASDPQLVADHERCRLLVEAFNATSVVAREARRALLHELFGAVGEGVEVKPPFQCDYGFNISCGDRTSSSTSSRSPLELTYRSERASNCSRRRTHLMPTHAETAGSLALRSRSGTASGLEVV